MLLLETLLTPEGCNIRQKSAIIKQPEVSMFRLALQHPTLPTFKDPIQKL
jgi:hypothetical protein